MQRLDCLEVDCNGRLKHAGEDTDGERFVCQTCGSATTIALPPVLSQWSRALAEGA